MLLVTILVAAFGSTSTPRAESVTAGCSTRVSAGRVVADRSLLTVVAGGNAIAVLRIAALTTAPRDAIAGILRGPSSGAIEVAVSPNGQYVFVSDEASAEVGVFDLARALKYGFGAANVALASVPVAPGPVGSGSPSPTTTVSRWSPTPTADSSQEAPAPTRLRQSASSAPPPLWRTDTPPSKRSARGCSPAT